MAKLLRAAVAPPRVMITDKLRSYGAALAKMGLRIDHRQHKGLTIARRTLTSQQGDVSGS
jgi:putative transposase